MTVTFIQQTTGLHPYIEIKDDLQTFNINLTAQISCINQNDEVLSVYDLGQVIYQCNFFDIVTPAGIPSAQFIAIENLFINFQYELS
jgi:hypothetical protein